MCLKIAKSMRILCTCLELQQSMKLAKDLTACLSNLPKQKPVSFLNNQILLLGYKKAQKEEA